MDKRKLPQGLSDLAERVNRLGMQFGLWFEPEMVSPTVSCTAPIRIGACMCLTADAVKAAIN